MKTIIIGIAGGTGSGKTTLTEKLRDHFGANEVSVLNHDSYYKRHDELPYEERCKLNYDHPDSFDTPLMVAHLRELRAGHPVQVPVYDYTIHNRSDKTEGIRFYKTDDPTVSYTLLCWTGGYGICGTGVTSEEITLANGMKVWQHTEENTEKGTMGMADIFFEDAPGSYVASPSETMTTEVWNANRDALLSILGTAQIGRKSVSQQAAIDAAKAQYTGAYDQVYATYDVTAGAWTVSFSKSAAGAKTDRLVVDAAGKVMAAGK